MAAVGGPAESVSIGGRLFSVAGDADVTVKHGGFESEISPNGDGTARDIKARVAWMFDGLNVSIDHDRGDQEFLQDLADGFEFVPIALTYVNGTVVQAKGKPVGELIYSANNATAAVQLGGPGKVEQQ